MSINTFNIFCFREEARANRNRLFDHDDSESSDDDAMEAEEAYDWFQVTSLTHMACESLIRVINLNVYRTGFTGLTV